ncbi:FAD-dependent oxidoreductase [Anaerocolumna xylanovorans]|uniref:2,4-dienoyl-CoA reductase n=1 Tax=Anaerocolumna xylanovorans DSM 12503 TaxID=1121345 RepID=A0A1M7XXJ0_9FIRM|nr:FAD-dependent oxidoreductase [Anaerocolumna xylanovorans]SHO43667.1 2,4-dienoyl-CoA reductase [Anaerocolumna xylanovorans DSM 12503]
MKYAKLFSQGRIGNVQTKNRIVMTAMGVDISHYDGTANENTIAYYAERAKGGVGLIITEYTRINEKDGVVAPAQLSMSSDKYIKPFSKVVDAVHQEGTKIFVQLHHPGRQNVVIFPTMWGINKKLAKIIPGYWKWFFSILAKQDADSMSDPKMQKMLNKYMRPLRAPSNVPAGLGLSVFGSQRIEPLSVAEIKVLVRQFIDAAVRVKKSGADGIELHAGHGYLLNQFLSPHTNIRTDKYGGNTENRTRILKEIIQGIHHVCGRDFPVVVRLTVDEFYEKIGYPEQGIHLSEGVKIAKALESFGADAIDVTAGTVETLFVIQEPNSFPLGWRKYMAQAIKEAVSIPVIAVGMIRTPDMAEKYLEEGVQDFIGLARPLLVDPHWAKKAELGQDKDIQRCIGCLYCIESYEKGLTNGHPVQCSLNPRTCREAKLTEQMADGKRRKIVIIGAGPSGLTAARELAIRNFDVTVLEKESESGGQLQLAKIPPHKERLAWCYEDLEYQAKNGGVTIIYNTTASKQLIQSMNPYAVIVATGASAFKPNIPGADAEYVTTTTSILDGSLKPLNKNIAVVGSGMTGIETAELLVEQGNRVTVIEMADKIAQGAFNVGVWEVMQSLDNGETVFLPGCRLERIEDHKLTLVQKNAVREILRFDIIVLSLGVRSNTEAIDELKGCCEKFYVIGDAKKPGRIKDSVHEAFHLAQSI